MRVKTELIQQYANVMIVNENTIAKGISRFGFLASSPVRKIKNNLIMQQKVFLKAL